jgi:hypothetical protein
MGTKYTGLLAVPALAICCAFVIFNRDRLNRAIGIRKLCVVLASPFYLRNWILLGCPIYPPPPGYALLSIFQVTLSNNSTTTFINEALDWAVVCLLS